MRSRRRESLIRNTSGWWYGCGINCADCVGVGEGADAFGIIVETTNSWREVTCDLKKESSVNIFLVRVAVQGQ